MSGNSEFSGGYPVAIALAVALVGANALFVMAEYALVRDRPSRLKELAQHGGRRAALALRLVQRLDEYSKANGSITIPPNKPHNPYIDQVATFTLSIAGLTSASIVYT